MRVGAIFPQLEIGTDPLVIRDYAQALEGMGYDHISEPEAKILCEQDKSTTREGQR